MNYYWIDEYFIWACFFFMLYSVRLPRCIQNLVVDWVIGDHIYFNVLMWEKMSGHVLRNIFTQRVIVSWLLKWAAFRETNALNSSQDLGICFHFELIDLLNSKKLCSTVCWSNSRYYTTRQKGSYSQILWFLDSIWILIYTLNLSFNCFLCKTGIRGSFYSTILNDT